MRAAPDGHGPVPKPSSTDHLPSIDCDQAVGPAARCGIDAHDVFRLTVPHAEVALLAELPIDLAVSAEVGLPAIEGASARRHRIGRAVVNAQIALLRRRQPAIAAEGPRKTVSGAPSIGAVPVGWSVVTPLAAFNRAISTSIWTWHLRAAPVEAEPLDRAPGRAPVTVQSVSVVALFRARHGAVSAEGDAAPSRADAEPSRLDRQAVRRTSVERRGVPVVAGLGPRANPIATRRPLSWHSGTRPGLRTFDVAEAAATVAVAGISIVAPLSGIELAVSAGYGWNRSRAPAVNSRATAPHLPLRGIHPRADRRGPAPSTSRKPHHSIDPARARDPAKELRPHAGSIPRWRTAAR